MILQSCVQFRCVGGIVCRFFRLLVEWLKWKVFSNRLVLFCVVVLIICVVCCRLWILVQGMNFRCGLRLSGCVRLYNVVKLFVLCCLLLLLLVISIQCVLNLVLIFSIVVNLLMWVFGCRCRIFMFSVCILLLCSCVRVCWCRLVLVSSGQWCFFMVVGIRCRLI